MKTRILAVVNSASCDRCARRLPPEKGEAGLGIHARPSAVVAKFGALHKEKITISRGGMSVMAESILGIMMLRLGPRQTIEVKIDDNDDAKIAEDFARLLVHGLQEPYCQDFSNFCKQKYPTIDEMYSNFNPLDLLESFAKEIKGRPICFRGVETNEDMSWT